MKCKLICPECGEIDTVYVHLGGIIVGTGEKDNQSEELHLLQTCAGDNNENIAFLLFEQNGSLFAKTIEFGDIRINALTDIGECGECGKKMPIGGFFTLWE